MTLGRGTVLGLLLWCATAACSPRSASQLVGGAADVSVGAGNSDAGSDAGASDAGNVFVDDGGCSCGSWGAAQNLGLLGDPELVELSGLAASRKHPGVYWAHNDSGDSARFFAVSSSAAGLGRFSLPGVVARDIEDLAAGPCPSGSCVFLGDIGDNLTSRNDYCVYRVAEPDLEADAGFTAVPVTFEKLDFTYPNNEHHNAETLLVHPTTGDLYVLTKHGVGVKSRVYRFPRPHTPGTSATLEYVTELPVPANGDLQLTGGDISPCGNALLLRMYNRVVELRMQPGQGFESVFTASVRALPTPVENQGEAVAWSLNGKSYLTASEGSGQQLHKVDCP
jgi:hypothetical protein